MPKIFFAIIFSMGAAVSLNAQTFLGTITGRAVDPSSASVAGASVTAANQSTGLVYKTVTNGAGNFALSQLPVGKYDVTVEAAGFRKVVRKDVELNVAQTLSIEAKLEVGEVEQAIEVTSGWVSCKPPARTSAPPSSEISSWICPCSWAATSAIWSSSSSSRRA